MSLVKWNLGAFALHTGLAIWSMTLPNKEVQLYKFAFDTTATPTSDIDYPQTLNTDRRVNIKPFVTSFFAITAFAHLLYASDFGRPSNGPYTRAIMGRGWNPFRWFEYSVTASLMIYIISIVAGAKEVSTALVATLITPGLMFQGFTIERELLQNDLARWSTGKLSTKPKEDIVVVMANLAPAWILFALKWFIIVNAWIILRQELEADDKTLDSRVTALVFTQLVGFTLFGVVQTLQVIGWTQKRGSSLQAPYMQFEKAYIVLSFVAKCALGFSVARLLN
jgi:hypothetical protein